MTKNNSRQFMLKIIALSTLLAASGATLAMPFNSFDPRSMAMGGAGVAVGNAATAPFFNPALLAITPAEDDFSLAVPIIGVRFYDPSNFLTSVDNFQKGNYVSNLDASITAYNANQSTGNLTTVGANITELSKQFATLSDKPLQGELGAGMVVAIPSKKLGGAFYATGWGAAGGVIKYRDATLLNDFVGISMAVNTAIGSANGCNGNLDPLALQTLALTNPAQLVQCLTDLNNLKNDPLLANNSFFTIDTTTNPLAPTVTSNFNSSTGLKSSVDIRGVMMTEMGLALSHEFGTVSDASWGGKAWGFGVTPKMVSVTLFNYTASVDSANNANTSLNDYSVKYSQFNFDLGLAKEYGNGWRTGFVVKNVIPHTYKFKQQLGAVTTAPTIKLKPQARVGVSHSTSWTTAAMDLDLTANDPAGLENKSQYLALGGELDLWLIQLRLGYRANLKDNARNVSSVGLGLGPLDLTVAGSGKEVGVSAAFGFSF